MDSLHDLKALRRMLVEHRRSAVSEALRLRDQPLMWIDKAAAAAATHSMLETIDKAIVEESRPRRSRLRLGRWLLGRTSR